MPRVIIFYIIFSYSINKKPFRLSKNGQATNIFKSIGIGNNEINNNLMQNINRQNFERNIKIKLTGNKSLKKYDGPKNKMDK